MPEFTQPWFLLLALIVPPLGWWWLRQRRGAVRFPSAAMLTGLPAGRAAFARWGGVTLRCLALLSLVIALSGPRWPDRRTRLPTEGIAVMMLLDVSGSMAEPDYDWDGEPVERLEAVKRAFRLFVEGGAMPDGRALPGRPTDLLGLVTFATRPDSPCPLTLSHSILLEMLDRERPRRVPGESQTNVSDAIVLGLHRLASAGPRRRVMILLSDGEHNLPAPPSGWTPRQAVQVAANLGVVIHTIDASGVASELGEPSPADGSRTLREVAAISRGKHFTARDTASLLGVCEEIDRMERAEIRSFQYRRYFDGYPWFGTASFVIWVLTQVLEVTLWRRLP
jgi:Ca-activated chloride channel family protein